MKIKIDYTCTFCCNVGSISHSLIDCKRNSFYFENDCAKLLEAMTGFNIREQNHIHESILFGIPMG